MNHFRPAVTFLLAFTIITGVAYPLAITAVAQAFFPAAANGSILRDAAGVPIGSSLLGQEFASPGHFWGRLSATAPVPYTGFNAEKGTGSSGSNYGPSNPALLAAAKVRLEALAAADRAAGYARPAGQRVPVDLVTASGSGLDPHISPAAAEYQLPRVARARGLSEADVAAIVRAHTRPRQWGIFGEPVVKVLELNLALDKAAR